MSVPPKDKPNKGGDKKSIEYIGPKNGSFITKFSAEKNSKDKHLVQKDVRCSQSKLDQKIDYVSRL